MKYKEFNQRKNKYILEIYYYYNNLATNAIHFHFI